MDTSSQEPLYLFSLPSNVSLQDLVEASPDLSKSIVEIKGQKYSLSISQDPSHFACLLPTNDGAEGPVYKPASFTHTATLKLLLE